MLRQTVLTANGFPNCSWAHVVISFIEWSLFLIQYRLTDRRSQSFSVDFRPCLRAEISPGSRNLLILWTVDDGIPKFFANLCWEMLFLFSLSLLVHESSFYTQSWLSINLFTCEMFQTGVLGVLFQLPHSFVVPVLVLLELVAGIKFKNKWIFEWDNQVISCLRGGFS